MKTPPFLPETVNELGSGYLLFSLEFSALLVFTNTLLLLPEPAPVRGVLHIR